jgi:HAD superfamily hydrolase (TIGR01509 family)
MRGRLQLVIFDCDGVLVDSEGQSREILLGEAARLGWALDEAGATGFTGRSWTDLQPLFEAGARHALPADWPLHMQARLVDRLQHGVSAMPGAADVLRATASLGLPYRIASNSSHAEMAAKFAATGLADLVAGRCHSAKDVGIGKPAPDLFLAAAAAERIAPEHCLVVEDSAPGVTAALRAGMDCVAYTPHGDHFGVVALGATPIHSLHELPAMLAEKMRNQAA